MATVNNPFEPQSGDESKAKPGKPPKPPKLTKAEKKALALEKMQALQTLIFRDHLRRELEYTKKSFRRGGEEWNAMIKKIRIRELLFELEDWRKRAWRLLDRKDYHIQLLLQYMDVAEEQHNRMFTVHCSIIDYLIDFCKHMIQSLKHVYETEAFEIILHFYEEKADRDKATARFRTYYENIMHANNLISEFGIQEAEEINIEKREDIINTSIHRCYQLRDTAIQKMNKLFQQLEKVFNDLEANTISIRPKEEMMIAMQKQKQYDIDLEKAQETAKDGVEQISQLQEKLTQTLLENHHKEKIIQEDRQSKHINFLYLKTKVKRYCELNDVQMQGLTTESYMVTEELKKLVNYGRHLIAVAFSCRKYQTEQEKVLPWPDNRKTDKRGKDGKDILTKSEIELSMLKLDSFKEHQGILEEIEKLQNFLYRSACCENQCRMLRKEKKELEEENKQYIELIRNCYEAMAYQKIMKHVKTSELLSTLKIERRGFN